jgi:hypothetical protein
VAEAIGSALFVGGPRDGQLTPLLDHHGEKLCVVAAPATEEGWWCTAPEMVSTAAFAYFTYQRLEFLSPGGPPVTCWVEAGLTAHDVMVRLVVGYHQAQTQKEKTCGYTSMG